MVDCDLAHGSIISIHALHEESDRFLERFNKIIIRFQSTLSMRRATLLRSSTPSTQLLFQSTLSMRRATAFAELNPRALVFQSTLSMRRATNATAEHNPSGEYFNPRSP